LHFSILRDELLLSMPLIALWKASRVKSPSWSGCVCCYRDNLLGEQLGQYWTTRCLCVEQWSSPALTWFIASCSRQGRISPRFEVELDAAAVYAVLYQYYYRINPALVLKLPVKSSLVYSKHCSCMFNFRNSMASENIAALPVQHGSWWWDAMFGPSTPSHARRNPTVLK
jgi:hypothetical protein